MRLRKFAFLIAALIGLTAPLTAATDVQPAVQPGGDIPPKFQPRVPAIPKGGDIPQALQRRRAASSSTSAAKR